MKIWRSTPLGRALRAWALAAALICAAGVARAQSSGGSGGSQDTTTTSTKTEEIDTTNNLPNLQMYSTQVIDLNRQTNTVLLDLTIPNAPSSAQVAAAYAQAVQTLHTDGLNSISGPTLTASSSTTGPSTQVSHVLTGSTISAASTVYVGPQTIFIGDNQAFPFVISPGSEDTDTLVTTTLTYQNNFQATTLNSATYEFFGLTQARFAFLGNFTPNQLEVAKYFDAYDTKVTTGDFGTIVGVLNATNAAGLPSDFSQLGPQELAIFSKIANNNAPFTIQGVGNHTANERDGMTGWDLTGLNYVDPTMDAGLSPIRSRLLAWNPSPLASGLISDTADPVLGGVDMKEMKTPVSDNNRWSAFIDGDVILADLSHSEELQHSDYTTGSILMGTDYRLDKNWTVGALFGYGHTDATLDHFGSDVTVDSYSPGLYASFADGGWYANGMFAYTYNDYSEDRVIDFLSRTAHGNPDGNQFTGDLDGGYEFHSGKWVFGPSAGLDYVHLDVGSFSESGAGAADLNIDDEQTDSMRSKLGGELRYQLSTGGVIFNPHLSAYWQHEFLDEARGITSSMSQEGLGSFTVKTDEPSRDSALVDLGLDTQVSDNVTLYVDYALQAGQSNYFAQSIEGGVKVGF